MKHSDLRESRGRRLAVAAVVLAAFVVVGGSAVAGHVTGTVKSYTGCLVSSDGVIIKLKEGDTPSSRCAPGQVEVHFSGGDISKISVGPGLSLPNGGDNGEVTIQLDVRYSLPQSCQNEQVAKWNGSAWICGNDNDTTYSGGTGLDLSASNVFSIEPDYRVKNNQSCTSGQFANGINSSGTLSCGSPAAGARVFANVQSPSSGIGIPSDLSFHQVVTLTIPAGAYAITAIGTGTQEVNDREWRLGCDLRAGSTVLSHTVASSQPQGGFYVQDTNDPAGSIAMISLRNFTSSATLEVTCATREPGVGARFFGIQAVKLD